MSKPREFLVEIKNMCAWELEDRPAAHRVCIHVIEYAAYEQAQSRIAELEAENERLKTYEKSILDVGCCNTEHGWRMNAEHKVVDLINEVNVLNAWMNNKKEQYSYLEAEIEMLKLEHEKFCEDAQEKTDADFAIVRTYAEKMQDKNTKLQSANSILREGLNEYAHIYSETRVDYNGYRVVKPAFGTIARKALAEAAEAMGEEA